MNRTEIQRILKMIAMYIASFLCLIITIFLLTAVQPNYRISSHTLAKLTEQVDTGTLLQLIGKENKMFQQELPLQEQTIQWKNLIFKLAPLISFKDLRSFISREIPGFPYHGQQLVISGSHNNFATQAIESAPPLEEIMKDREAVFSQEELETEEILDIDEQVVFLYNTHNRESFLPHLPDESNPNHAYHETVNITKVSEHLANTLQTKGIGVKVDKTDFTNTLNDKGWTYGRSYDVSREVVQDVFADDPTIEYVFDIHRDSLPKSKTTIEIDGETYGKILFVIGAENKTYEKNLEIATALHDKLENKYPGLSRGVLTKKGAGTNGVYNQDLFERSLLIEMGGYDNELTDLYRSADALADVFSEYYNDAQAVQGN